MDTTSIESHPNHHDDLYSAAVKSIRLDRQRAAQERAAQVAEWDRDLRAAVLKCLELNRQYAAAILGADEDESPEAMRISDELCQLILTIRQTPAETLDGMLAKIDLHWALTDHTGLDAKYLKNDHPLDPDLIGQSICHDLTRFAGHPDDFTPDASGP
jgi:hypothetical protein